PGAQTNAGERAVSLSYQVFHRKQGEEYPDAPAETTDKSYSLTDLDPDATYTWYVKVVQSNGQTLTKDSKEWTFKTGAGGATGKPIKRYNSSGALQKDYDKLSDAVNEADNGDRIEVVGGMELKEEPEITINGTEVTIHSSNPNNPFIIDMSGGRSAPGSKRGENRVFHITNGASVTIRDAIIKGGVATDDLSILYGGGISITERSTVTTINATIIDNTAGIGGGVSVEDGCTFNALDTTIASNTSTKGTGGGVYVIGGTFNANNVIIRKNQAKGGAQGVDSRDVRQMKLVGGDVVAVLDGAFNTVGRSIRESGERAGTSGIGGGVAVVWDSIFNATETTIMENTAKAEGEKGSANGGGVVVWRSTFNAYSGTAITGNRAESEEKAYGGGVVVDYGGTFNAYEGSMIEENIAEGVWANGGGVAVLKNGGTFNATGTMIASNTVDGSHTYGGGVFVSRNGSFIASNADIKLNRATGPFDWNGQGGGVAVRGGTFEAKDETSISSNSAGYGGGVSVEDDRVAEEAAVPGTFNAEDGTVISENNATQKGGGIWWVAADKISSEILGKITTNGKDWTPQADQQDNFSVDTNGSIRTPANTGHPVQVLNNTAGTAGSAQMNVIFP
ncbi:MAG TPA: hypothetical protein PKL87_09570, partial [Thermotogota bacterium]|nr:hypothetical protein [Thermotogota bacterium]HOF24354.1 hypothetical protein [Thermotogota bacterium]HOS25687.1 hypothetical protein [Thermotogota bacterium]HOT87159.1 hypothetical protein [Thermotogota bacterium]HPL39760.1 hypothetical protein [Thermotogota bacterium]